MEELFKQLIQDAIQESMSKLIGTETITYPEVMTIETLENYLTVSRPKIMDLIENEDLPHFKIGAQYRFNLEEIRSWRLEQSKASFRVVPVKNEKVYRIAR